MLSLREHIEAESARWASSRRGKQQPDADSDERSSTSSLTSAADSVFSSSRPRCCSKYHTRALSRRSSTSSFATEFEPEPAAEQQPFAAPRDFDGSPITVYASLEAAAAQSSARVTAAATAMPVPVVESSSGRDEEQPRRLVTPGKLYENEEDDDEIVYE
ncbi:hypothetical protein F4802DRAFT_127287 [Xylaria palmicola]|nr:hypothetical protein F4802DRAFT_127287 [Xylaria palmicola]